MCRHCASFPAGPVGLSRRSFHKGALAAAMSPACVSVGNDPVEPAMRLVVPDGAARTVALTLDACSGGTDMRIIETLTGLAVPATIFVTGLWLRANRPAAAVFLARPDLFTLQNHGDRHVPPVLGTRLVFDERGIRCASSISTRSQRCTCRAWRWMDWMPANRI